MKPELQTLWEIERRAESGAVVLHWPTRRVYVFNLTRNNGGTRFEATTSDHDGRERIKQDYGRRCWVFRASV